jgi:leucyl aminopeptidase
MQIKNTPKQISNKNFVILIDPKKLATIAKIKDISIPNTILNELKLLKKEQFIGNSTFEIINSNSVKNKQKIWIFSYNSSATNIEKLRLLGSKIGKQLNTQKIANINLYAAHQISGSQLSEILNGINAANYKFDTFLSQKPVIIEEINLLNQFNSSISATLKQLKSINQAVNLVKDLVNTPPISMTPEILASEAKKLCTIKSGIKFKLLSEKDIKKLGLNLIYAVGMGSGQDSKLILMEYLNGPKNQAPTMLVGKGVTFDAGGLNLKPTNSIETMKIDMSGAATVIGLFKLLSELKPKINVIGVIPAVENLLGHNAYKPGDVIKSYTGKTVEITNTDAEGRLILADAISYGIKKYGPSQIIDIATLTGACLVALGYTRTGVITNNRQILSGLKKASRATDEKIWHLPLDSYHKQKVAGEISDYKNWSAGVNAGASMGGAFIEKFVEGTPWAHLDIAGTAYLDSTISYRDKGATGQPLQLIYEYLTSFTPQKPTKRG